MKVFALELLWNHTHPLNTLCESLFRNWSCLGGSSGLLTSILHTACRQNKGISIYVVAACALLNVVKTQGDSECKLRKLQVMNFLLFPNSGCLNKHGCGNVCNCKVIMLVQVCSLSLCALLSGSQSKCTAQFL